MFSYLLALVLIVVISLGGLKLTHCIGLLDRPGKDIKKKRMPVPTLQGIFLYLALALVLFFVFPQERSNNSVTILLLGGGGLVLLAFVDEYCSIKKSESLGSSSLVDVIPSGLRLLIQLIIVALVIYHAGFYQQELIFSGTVRTLPLWLGAGAALIRFLLFINAINWFDGIYAQSSGLSAVGFATIFGLLQFVVLPHYGDISAENLALLTTAKTVSFVLMLTSIVYSIVEYKPYGLIRDTGTLFYGFALAYLSLLGGAKVGTIMVALSLPLFDAAWVCLHRLFVMKKNPMKGDYSHLHYRLLSMGWTKSEVRAFVRIWSCVMMVLMLLQGINTVHKIVIFSMMALLFFGVNAYIFWYKKTPINYTIGKKG